MNCEWRLDCVLRDEVDIECGKEYVELVVMKRL